MKKLTFTIILFVISVMVYGQTSVRFVVEDLPQITHEKVGIRGNLPPLDWSKSIVLKKEGTSYVIDINFPSNEKELEFKFVLFTDDKNPTW